MRTGKAQDWVHEGDYETVSAAAGRIVEIEEYPVKGLFLKAHALPGSSDDETLGLSWAGGSLENAQAMAAHESPRTTKLYDRTDDVISLDEIERITI